jgi:(p)ppGpp synthase/HD superfamily hydrolase
MVKPLRSKFEPLRCIEVSQLDYRFFFLLTFHKFPFDFSYWPIVIIVAEFGMAAHWAYKDGSRRQLDQNNASPEKMSEVYNTPWLSTIKEWQDEVVCSRDFVDCVRRELLGKRVFVFLRNGKILNISKGSTAIDAAFQIHSEVGLTMTGAEINGKPVS